ncbi:IclR family transcriptional regulator [Paracoccus lutimaris]|uniref:IclR family transcriptional regulator n=1 Tax=Paracoccus lutimaris TaxID=1490030 RepID=A0A368Z3J8_9RHOB|nr:IclR family transcriptional regulator [Paracoccus lutimaris]RCW87033.1 IclR family transcriptional regulator [Paracoccus lutimaris]
MRQPDDSLAETTKKYSAPALEKGLDILELLSTEEAGLSQTEIARRLDRSVSEIFRMLVVLQDRAYVALDPLTDRYALTTLLFEVAHRTPPIRRLTTLSAPIMQQLARKVNQSTHLAILSEDSVLVIGQVQSPGNNNMSVRLGAKIDLWRASSGRVILAYQPEDVLRDYFTRIPMPANLTEHEVRAELARIRATGHETRDSFVVRGIVNISVPVFDHSGHAAAALTIPHLERYGDPISFDICREAVIEAAAALSRGLGGGAAKS